ncbi:MAG TPA: hypothetical protein VII21_06270 [Aestuariivirga sp.]
MSESDNLVLMLLREVRSEVGDMRKDMATKNDVIDVRSEVKSLRADVASDLMTMEKRLGERIAHLNRAVMEYHSSAVGHGVLISEFEERLRRVEQHLKLPTAEGH